MPRNGAGGRAALGNPVPARARCFSSLTVRQNIQFPVREYLNVTQRLLDEITVAKLGMVGLRPEVRPTASLPNCRAA